MAEGEEVLYESLDSHTSDEDVDEYITVSTPLPYLQPEVPYKNSPPVSLLQPGGANVGDNLPPSFPRENLQLRSPIHANQPGRKPIPRPVQAPYEPKMKKALPVNQLKLPPKMASAVSPLKTDYHKLVDDDNQVPPPRPKPAPLPKPRFSLKPNRKKKKGNVRYVHPEQFQQGQGAHQEGVAQENLLPPKPDASQTQSEINEDDVYYDKVLSRTKWRNILKRKKMKMAAKQPAVTSYPIEERYKDNTVSSTHSGSSTTKKALEYSDDELKLKSGNPRVVCILLSIILVALLVSIVSLAVSMVGVSQTRKIEDMVRSKDMWTSKLNCSTELESSRNWIYVKKFYIPINGSVAVFAATVSQQQVDNAVSWSCDITTPTGGTWENCIFSSSWASSENHTHTCECRCFSLLNYLSSPEPTCDLKTTQCTVLK